MIAKKDKLKKDDRILELRVIDGEKPLSSIGLVDKRLFQGGNKLHAYYNPQFGCWKLRYEVGFIPQALENSWSTFDQLIYDTSRYLKGRNLEIAEVID